MQGLRARQCLGYSRESKEAFVKRLKKIEVIGEWYKLRSKR